MLRLAGISYTKKITGKESKPNISNDNESKLIVFATEQKIKIMSTHFKRKDI